VAAGLTASTDFPVVQAAQAASGGGNDAFVARLDPSGGKLLYAGYWGGSAADQANGLALDAEGRAVLAGATSSPNFPTSAAAYQKTNGGGQDAFVAELDISPTPPDYVPCNCHDDQPIGAANGNGGGDPADLGVSPAGVRYADGAVNLYDKDLVSANFGTPWGQARSWSNAAGAGARGGNGSGVVNGFLPYLEPASGTNTLAVVTTGTDTRYFDLVNGVYQERFFLGDTLTYNGAAGEYVLTDPTGAKLTFYDFSSSRPVLQRGAFVSYTDPDGNVTSVTSWTGDGQAAEVQRSGGGETESLLYTYGGTPGTRDLLTNVALRHQPTNGAWTVARQVAYTYHDGTTAGGNLGDLQTATIEDGSGNALDTYYYRYWTPGQSGGYAGGLKYAFGPDAYRRLSAAVGNPLTAADAQVAPYADSYFEYDAQHRVTKAVLAGDGTTEGGAGGQGTYTYSYTTSGNAAGFNSWAVKTVEALPDGSQNTVYTNAYAEPMLVAFKDAGSGQTWDTYYRFDGQGRLILQAQPSALTGYDDTHADLLNNQGGNYQYLSDGTGLIQQWTYATATTATETAAGNVAGYLQQESVQRGELGTPVVLDSQLYFQHTAGGITIDPVASSTVYRNADGTGAETTSNAYTWSGSTVGVQSLTVTLPVISAAQNGPGVADVQTTYFDGFGRPVWSKDGGGYLSYTAYDPATGAVSKTIDDVNTADTGDFTGLPSGWSTPSGGGLELVTQYVVDALGRPTKVTDPDGNVSYAVYKDANHEVRVYAGWNSSTNTPTGPTQVYRDDLSGSYSEVLTMSAAPNVTGGQPDGSEPVSGVQTLSRTTVNAAGQVISQDDYFNLSGLTYSVAAGLGVENTNFYRTRYAYDAHGNPDRVQAPTGTIDRNVFDGQGRVVSAWEGTNDTPARGTWSPTNNTGSANMVQLAGYVYDGGGVGDGNLTQETDYPGGSAAARVMQFFFDWRDRLVAEKDGVQATEDTSTHRPITYYDLNNLGEVTAVSQYNGDGVSITDGDGDGVPDKPAAGLLRSYTVTAYDDQGRPYQAQTFSVDPNTGAVSSSALTENLYYDHRGEVIADAQPGGLWDKAQYDGAGRQTADYQTDGAGGSTWAGAASVSGDNVLEQTQTQYDADGNPILTTTRQRFDSETATGSLGDPNNSPKARVYYLADWYDAAGRPTAEADVGTNGGAAYTRPATPPAASDTVLLTTWSYNAAGWLDTTTDPRGIQTKDYYDNLGQVTKEVADYTGGSPSNSSDQTTEYGYDGDGNPLYVQVDLPGGAVQKTQYLYGATTAGGSDVNSNDLLVGVQYPDPTTGQPSAAQQEKYTVNALGETKTVTDRNGNVHTLSYDVLGRLTSDAVTTLGAGVDGAVRRIDTAYDAQGNPYLFTSYADTAGTTVINQVQQTFNGLGQLTADYQAHGGAVNASSTPSVQYAWSQMAGGANNSRLVSMTYPNGRVLNYNYASGVDNAISRLTSISDASGTLEQESYLGLGTVVQRAHPLSGVNLTYIKQAGENNGDAGDPYTGLDRFGRVVDQRWVLTSNGTATDRFQYGYDRDGNALYRANLVNHNFDELYHASGAGNGYDNLNRLTAFSRGQLSASQQGGPLDTVASPSHSQSWALDAQGNFASVTTDGTPTARNTNAQNETTQVGSAALAYDGNGDLTKDQAGQQLVWDAWGRLVQVKSASGGTLASYAYDGLGRRVQEAEGGTTTDLYYNADGQVVEERVGGQARVQYVWSPVATDTLVERDRDPTGGGTLSERLWVQQDANGDVTALVNSSGQVVERYAYDPYGAVTVLDANWNVRTGGSAYAWRYLFQGGRYDTATGYYNFRARDYSPTLGTWLRNDPLGFGGGDTNLYRFVTNNPLNEADPTGLFGLLTLPLFWATRPDSEGGNVAQRTGRALERSAETAVAAQAAPATIVIDALQAQVAAWSNVTNGLGLTGRYRPRFVSAPGQAVGQAIGQAQQRNWPGVLGTAAQVTQTHTTGLIGGLIRGMQTGRWDHFDRAYAATTFDVVAGLGPHAAVPGPNNTPIGPDGRRIPDVSNAEVEGAIRDCPTHFAGPAAPAGTWTRPPGWRLPRNGTWSGTPGHSEFIPTNPAELGLAPGTWIPFRNGYPDFSAWSRGSLQVPGLNGSHAHDMPLIYEAVARQQGLPNPTAAQNWLFEQGLTPHHAGGDAVQLIPRQLHGNVRHMGGAWELRNP
jgi:RHS repeat-associated protein